MNKKWRVIIAKILVFVLATAYGGGFLQITANWVNILGVLDVSNSLYLTRAFQLPNGGFVGQAGESIAQLGGSGNVNFYFVTSTNGVDWHVQRPMRDVIHTSHGVFGIADQTLFRSLDDGVTWQRAEFEIRHVQGLDYAPGISILRFNGFDAVNQNWVMMISDNGGDTWEKFALPENISMWAVNILTVPNIEISSFGTVVNDMMAWISKISINGTPPQFVRIYYAGQLVSAERVRLTGTAIATPFTNNVTLNGEPVFISGYTIDGNNFFRLRDIAYIMNRTWASFNVGWDVLRSAVTVQRWGNYVPIGGELQNVARVIQQVTYSDVLILIGESTWYLTSFNICGNDYFMIRDIGALLFDFNVDWCNETSTIQLTAMSR